MSIRKLDDKTVGNKRVVLYYNSDAEEYKLKFYVDGEYQEDSDYFDQDKESVLLTASTFLGVTL